MSGTLSADPRLASARANSARLANDLIVRIMLISQSLAYAMLAVPPTDVVRYALVLPLVAYPCSAAAERSWSATSQRREPKPIRGPRRFSADGRHADCHGIVQAWLRGKFL